MVGNAGQEGIRRADEKVCRKAARYAGKSGCHPCQRMPSGHGKDQGANGNNDDITCIRGNVGHDPGKKHNGGEELRVSVHEKLFQGCIEESRPFSNTDTEHGYKDCSQRGKSGKVLGCRVEHVAQAIRGEQGHGFFGDFGLGTGVKIGDGDALGSNKMGYDDDDDR